MRLSLAIVLIAATVASSFEGESNREKRQAYYNRKPQTTLPPLDGYTSQGVPVVRSSYAQTQHVGTHFDGPTRLDHYRDYVSDPYKPTEDLATVVRNSRQRPETRSGFTSGYPSAGDDDIYNNRRRQGGQADQQGSSATWGRVPDPWNRHSGKQWRNDHQSYSSPYEAGSHWEVASRGTDHVTYRRRNSDQGYNHPVTHPPHYYTTTSRPQLRQHGEGEGKVLARVVNLRSGHEQLVHDNSRRNSAWTRQAQPELRSSNQPRVFVSDGDWHESFRNENQVTYRRHGHYETYNPQRPQVRSLDPNPNTGRTGPVREGDWIKTRETDTEVIWQRMGTIATTPTPRPRWTTPRQQYPARSQLRSLDTDHSHYGERRGDWVAVSESKDHITWKRIGHSTPAPQFAVRRDHYRDHQPSLTRENYYQGPTQRPIHYYPTLNDRATAEKASRAGDNIMIRPVYQ